MAPYWPNIRNMINSGGKYMVNTRASSSLTNKPGTAPSVTAKTLHLSAKQEYPQAEPLPMPLNIDPTESHRFSPQRDRDLSSSAISTNFWNQRVIDITIDSTQYDIKSNADPHVQSYDCRGAVNLNSSMQSNVPSPLGGMHKYSHLNMPGGQWSQGNKFLSHDLHSSHYTTLRRETRKNWSKVSIYDENGTKGKNETNHVKNDACLHGKNASLSKIICDQIMRTYSLNAPLIPQANYKYSIKPMLLSPINISSNRIIHRLFSNKKEIMKNSEKGDAQTEENVQKKSDVETAVVLSPREKLKAAVKDYGATVFIFHIAISLTSLGIFYQLVSSGLDVVAILDYIGLGASTSSTISNNLASGASTFVVAYAVHKVFAPFRISLTLLAAPFIVRYLRGRGILSVKKPTKKP